LESVARKAGTIDDDAAGLTDQHVRNLRHPEAVEGNPSRAPTRRTG
jgi:hypothetical protein